MSADLAGETAARLLAMPEPLRAALVATVDALADTTPAERLLLGAALDWMPEAVRLAAQVHPDATGEESLEGAGLAGQALAAVVDAYARAVS